MKARREQQLYYLSDQLGIEVYVLEVGRQTFLPKQTGFGGSVETAKGATWEFMQAAIDRPHDPITWTHTHPGMSAFFSSRDIEGSHILWNMVRRPLTARVLGKDGDRHEEHIDAAWITIHPAPPKWNFPFRFPNRWDTEWENGPSDWQRSWEDDYAFTGQGYYSHAGKLKKILGKLLTVWGSDMLLNTLDQMNVIQLLDSDARR